MFDLDAVHNIKEQALRLKDAANIRGSITLPPVPPGAFRIAAAVAARRVVKTAH